MKDGTINGALVELGTASIETKGPSGPITDQRFGMFVPGLAED